MLESELGTLKAMLEGQAGPPPAIEEPSPRKSAQRFVTAPLHTH